MRADRVPSEEENVFCLVTCGYGFTLEDEDDVDVRDGASIVSAILLMLKRILCALPNGGN